MDIVKFDSKISWIVVVACACMNLLISIPAKVGGLLFVEIIDRYQINRNLAGYPAFTITLIRCSGAPFTGYFAERFGFNEVMILGSVLSAVGISACFFAEDISALIIFIGLIHGFGVAFNNSLLPQIVKIHFKRHLTLAYGMTQAGGSFGGFFAPSLLLWIFRSYGTSGGFLIMGALILNSLPLVLILNVLSPDRFYGEPGNSMKHKVCPEGHLEMGVTNTVTSSEGEGNNITNYIGGEKDRDIEAREKNTAYKIRNSLENQAVSALVLSKLALDDAEGVPGRTDGETFRTSSESSISSLSGKETGKDRMEHVFDECGIILEVKPKNTIHEKKMKVDIDTKINELENNFKEVSIPILNTRPKLTSICEENQQHSNVHIYSMSEYKIKVEINDKDLIKQVKGDAENNNPNKNSKSVRLPCKLENNISVSSYLADRERILPQKMEKAGQILPPSHNALDTRPSEHLKPRNEEINQKELLKADEKPAIGPTITKNKAAKTSLKIFLDVTYWIVIITQSFLVFLYVIFWNTVLDFSRDKNIERSKEVYLLMTLPIAEIIGRVGLGWITDSNYLTRINYCILSFVVLGISCSHMAFAQGFYVVMASIFVFGVMSGGLIAVFPFIIFEFFDSGKHTMGQASRYCLFGPLCFLNGPLIGYFRGTLGSYAFLYHILGLVSLACAALSALIPVLARMRDEKKNKRS